MLEQVQVAGIKKWNGAQFLTLQHELLGAMQDFLGDKGMCILQGCGVEAADALFNISPGLVIIKTADEGYKIARFAGVNAVALPGYLRITKEEITGDYKDNVIAKVANYYTATFVEGAADGTQLQLPIIDPSTGVNLTFDRALAIKSNGTTHTSAGATATFVTDFKAVHNYLSQMVHITATITVRAFASIPGNDSVINVGTLPVAMRPSVQRFFTGYFADDDSIGNVNNYYKRDINNIDYLRSFVGWVNPNGQVYLRVIKPAASSGLTEYNIKITDAISLL